MAVPSSRAEAHGRVRAAVSRAFDRLYTKHKASYGGVLRAVVVLLTFADIGLFQKSHRSSYPRADVIVTYILLCCTAALELVSASVVLGSSLPETDDHAAQYNLIGYLTRNKKYQRFRHIVFLMGFKDQLDWIWPTAPPEPTRRITELVHDHVAGGWKGIESVEHYRRFNDSRGQRTLERAGLFVVSGGGSGETAVEKSVRMPFDESVVVWHVATELCYFDHVDAGGDATWHGRVISNYMAYLLFVRPWMLLPGTRRKLFRAMYVELREMIKEKPLELEEEDDEEVEVERRKKAAAPRAMDEIARKIIQKRRKPPPLAVSSSAARRLSTDLVRKAWELSYELLEFGKNTMEEKLKEEEEKEKKKTGKEKISKERKSELMNQAKKEGDDKMWGVIQGVWVEMLCFSAGRCGGYLHAKCLGNGGEYLTYVWLLLSYMGMETMAERMQRMMEIPAEGDAGALVSTSDLEEEDDDEPAVPTGAATTSVAAAVVPIVVGGDDDNV